MTDVNNYLFSTKPFFFTFRVDTGLDYVSILKTFYRIQ